MPRRRRTIRQVSEVTTVEMRVEELRLRDPQLFTKLPTACCDVIGASAVGLFQKDTTVTDLSRLTDEELFG